MKREKLLVLLIGIQILGGLFSVPFVLRLVDHAFDNGIFANLHILGFYVLRFLFMSLGAIGIIQYWKTKNFRNSFLKLYIIYYFIKFLLVFPAALSFHFSQSVSYNFGFYIFNILSILIVILTVRIYRAQKNPLDGRLNATKSIRSTHLIVDMLMIVLISLELNQYYQNFGGLLLISRFFWIVPIVMVTYYSVAETLFQQTIGKVFTNRYVARTDGTSASFVRILKRSLIRLLFFEAFSYLFNPSEGWHDHLSETNVYALGDLPNEEDDILDHLVERDEI